MRLPPRRPRPPPSSGCLHLVNRKRLPRRSRPDRPSQERRLPDRPAPPRRLPAPGPSFLRPLELRHGDRSFSVGLARPAAADEWWTTILWVADEAGIVDFVELGPLAGPPPDPPLARLGPALAGELSGFVLEADGRLQLRLGNVIPAADPERPWRAPTLVRLALRWEPARAVAMRDTELAAEALGAFHRGVGRLGRS